MQKKLLQTLYQIKDLVYIYHQLLKKKKLSIKLKVKYL
jgi:hypothetical protein